MPFILQCPYCKKYMILEDNQRGSRVKCLISGCSHWIDQEPSGSGERVGRAAASAAPPPVPAQAPATAPSRAPAAAPATSAGPAVLAAQRQRIVQCPRCQTPLRVPPAERAQVIRCPKCQQVFQG
jgi:uncharacterized protein YbaR (Trm112 family)